VVGPVGGGATVVGLLLVVVVAAAGGVAAPGEAAWCTRSRRNALFPDPSARILKVTVRAWPLSAASSTAADIPPLAQRSVLGSPATVGVAETGR
jgi:hypothetical protein